MFSEKYRATAQRRASVWQRLFLLLSQAANAFFFDGDTDESVSARAWRQRDSGWPRAHRRIDRCLGSWHCKRAYDAQRAREAARTAVPEADRHHEGTMR